MPVATLSWRMHSLLTQVYAPITEIKKLGLHTSVAHLWGRCATLARPVAIGTALWSHGAPLRQLSGRFVTRDSE